MADTDITPADFIALADALEDQARAAGRREIYQEILKITNGYDGPFNDLSCNFCGCDRLPPVDHRPDCLWLRARAAVESAKANYEQP